MSVDVTSALRVAGQGALAAGTLAAGAAIGAVAERLVMRLAASDAPNPGDDVTFHPRILTALADDGNVIHVEVDEPADFHDGVDLTVIFCHGYALNLETWKYQRAALQGQARLVFYDQRSHGKSGRGEFDSHHVEQLGRDLAHVMNFAAPTGPVVLVGHSMGGMTIMAWADDHRDELGSRVVGVALIATTAGGLEGSAFGFPGPLGKAVQKWAPVVADALAERKNIVEKARWSDTDIGVLVTRLYSFGSSAPRHLGPFVAGILGSTPVDVVAEFLPALQDHERHYMLPVFQKVETLVIVGTADRLTPVALSDEIVAAIPGAEYVIIPDCGHMLMLERAPEVNEALEGLLQRVKRERDIA